MNLKIETKFNVQDRVYFISGSEATTGIINNISTQTVLFEGAEMTTISYGVEGFVSQVRESNAFASQKELAESLYPIIETKPEEPGIVEPEEPPV